MIAAALAAAATLFAPGQMVAFDLETFQIEPGLLTPRIVCGSIATPSGANLLDRDGAIDMAHSLLDSDRVIVGANIAFDFGCLAAADPNILPAVFRAYEAGRVFDVQIAQALHAIAEGNLYLDPRTGEELATIDPLTGKRKRGRYSLERCVDLVLAREDAKARDYWRRRYALLADVPIADWPTDAREYPLDDARNTLEVAIVQVSGGGAGCTPGPHRNLGDLAAQAETAWAMHLGAIWGLRTDRGRVEALRASVETAHASFVEKFDRLGFFKKDRNGVFERNEKGHIKEDGRAVKRAVIIAYGGSGPCGKCVEGKVLSPKSGRPINCAACSGTGLDVTGVPLTPTGGVCADRDAKIESGDPDLVAFGDNEPKKILETYLPFLEEGVDRPITLRPNVLLASGRTSYDGLIQLIPKEGGARECLAARGGSVFCDVDYQALELCTLAQVCYWLLGRSQMMETINATGEPGALHTAFAASLAGISVEEMASRIKSSDPAVKKWAKKYRDAAKAGNFGFPGGMGAAKFVFAKRKKSEGSTTAPDGLVYPGIRFCLLLGDAERCGVKKFYPKDRNGRPLPAICAACHSIVAEQLRPTWFRQWPEIGPATRPGTYLNWVNGRVERGEPFPCLPTERVRGGCDFPNGANNGFQALGADAAKYALRVVTRHAYGVGPEGRESILYRARTRPIYFTHDAVTSEMSEDLAHLAGPAKAALMVSAAREYVPDVAMRAEAALLRFMSKAGADAVHDATGKLIPYEDRVAA